MTTIQKININLSLTAAELEAFYFAIECARRRIRYCIARGWDTPTDAALLTSLEAIWVHATISGTTEVS
jgi:hypothetical protein